MQKNDGKKWKNNSVPNTCNILPLKKFFFQNRCIFQVTLKYIKLVIPKILFILVLYNFNFYFKTPWPPKQNPPPPPTPPPIKQKNENFWPSSKDFSILCPASVPYNFLMLLRRRSWPNVKTISVHLFYSLQWNLCM